MVRERAAKGRLADDVAGDADARGVESDGQLDRGALRLGAHGRELDELRQCAPTPVVHDASGRADVRIGERRDVLLQEIDEPALALEDREPWRWIGEVPGFGYRFLQDIAQRIVPEDAPLLPVSTASTTARLGASAAAPLPLSPRDPASLQGASQHGGVDLGQADAAAAVFAAVTKQHGRLDGLVNIAGGFRWEKVQGGSLDTWDTLYRMNLRTAVSACQAALAHLPLAGIRPLSTHCPAHG